jgi:hypothetical protein
VTLRALVTRLAELGLVRVSSTGTVTFNPCDWDLPVILQSERSVESWELEAGIELVSVDVPEGSDERALVLYGAPED